MASWMAGDLPGFRMGQVIGAGGSGTVHAATRISDEVDVAVKSISCQELSERAVQAVIREVEIHGRVCHPNVVKLLNVFEEDDRLRLVLERADSGDLTQVMELCRQGMFDVGEDRLLFGFVQIALALGHLHSQGVLHRDVKPQNILVHKGNLLKLSDFGSAVDVRYITSHPNEVAGSTSYLAPEVLQGQGYSEKSDVWAMGCVLYELISLRQAFEGSTVFAVMHNIVSGQRKPLGGRCSPELHKLVDDMLQYDPQQRPSMREVLCSPFVVQYAVGYARFLQQQGADVSLLRLQDLGVDLLAWTDKPAPVMLPCPGHAEVVKAGSALLEGVVGGSVAGAKLIHRANPQAIWAKAQQECWGLGQGRGGWEPGSGTAQMPGVYDPASRLADWKMVPLQTMLTPG